MVAGAEELARATQVQALRRRNDGEPVAVAVVERDRLGGRRGVGARRAGLGDRRVRGVVLDDLVAHPARLEEAGHRLDAVGLCGRASAGHAHTSFGRHANRGCAALAARGLALPRLGRPEPGPSTEAPYRTRRGVLPDRAHARARAVGERPARCGRRAGHATPQSARRRWRGRSIGEPGGTMTARVGVEMGATDYSDNRACSGVRAPFPAATLRA
jgi:hypothetical protein